MVWRGLSEELSSESENRIMQMRKRVCVRDCDCVCKLLCVCLCKLLSRARLFSTLWSVGHQAPLSMEFSRHVYWSGLPFPPPRKPDEVAKEHFNGKKQ